MATTRDIEEIVSKLSSDKAKARDEGIKLLNSWLEGDRSFGFCKLLAKNTARIKPDEFPRAETWPFLIILLTKCITVEISASKRRPPKLLLAKTLRTAIQCAEDPKFGIGGRTLLLSVVIQLFNHIWDVLKDVPSFQSEYSSILRLLLAIKEYRYQMRRRVYCGLVVLYMKRVGMAITMAENAHVTSKEELFRCILTLHVLLENSPGDFPDNIREDIVTGFIDIFSNIRDEGKISRKLMECINTFLIKDGANLGYQTLEIHYSVQDFMIRCWLTTHDRGLKNSFIIYARVQLKLSRRFEEGSSLVEQLLDIVTKELDQSTLACTTFWSDPSRDDKVGSLGSIQQGLMELAASVFYQAGKSTTKILLQEKRLKMENAAIRVKDGLMKGSWTWNGAFCFLVHNYGCRINKSLLIDWFEIACRSLQRILNNLASANSYDALLWLLRALQELSTLLILPTLKETSKSSFLPCNEDIQIRNYWNVIWTSLLHGLPVFSNVTVVVNVALTLLGDMISREQVGAAVVPQDLWDLRIFKHMPSSSALYFISCYFSRISVQGDPRDLLYIRKNLLRATLELVNFKEPICLTENMIMLVPAAAFSLCAGCAPILPDSRGEYILSEENEEHAMISMEDCEHKLLAEVVECSVEVLSEMKNNTNIEVKLKEHQSIRLPRQVRQPLVDEMEGHITSLISAGEGFEKVNLAHVVNICCLFCNWIYNSVLSRLSEEKQVYMTKMFDFGQNLVDLIVSMIEEKCNEIQNCGTVGFSSIFDASGSTLCSLRGLVSSPLFSLSRQRNVNYEQLETFSQSMRRILVAFAKLFAVISNSASNNYSALNQGFPLSSVASVQGSSSTSECIVQIVDMDLDVDNGSQDTDPLAASGSGSLVTSFSPSQCKLKLVSVISTFFSVSPLLTWETLLSMIEKEDDDKVSENILYNLCKYFPGLSGSFSALVGLVIKKMGENADIKLCSNNTLYAIHALLENLLSTSSKSRFLDATEGTGNILSEESKISLCELLNGIAESGLPDWFARVKLIDCICSFVLFEPHIAQGMIGKLLGMLQDTDYRVRFFIARNIGVLFQTWDGHIGLFDDICSNFGFNMVRTSKEKLVKATEVLENASPSILVMETALITLAHVALYSKEIEIEAVFMICVVAAMDTNQRKLAYALLDNLSRWLQYSSRFKYLDELIGSILSRWVACEVSLLALIEVQDIFANTLEQKLFMQYCCPWILPSLILRKDIPNLNLVSKVACKPVSILAKEFFVPIFAVCLAVHCNSKPEKESGGVALHSAIMHIAEISELERDELIKKNMVSIVSFLLSLASSSTDPAMPSFTKDTVVLSVQTIVDGFFEMDDSPKLVGVIDKINIFRPDRVFNFLVEMHYQITTAIHPWHKCHRLLAVEVLIQIIGHRATVPSTSNYIFSILGQFIKNQSLQDQCCHILSTLLEVFKTSTEKDVSCVLGKQLQFLVSKLVACCIPSDNQGVKRDEPSSRVISLLHQLIVHADPSLNDFIRELEPLPQVDCLEDIRIYHENLCKTYSSKDWFLMFVRRSISLPRGLLLWSLRTLHKKLLSGEIIMQNTIDTQNYGDINCWSCDPEVVAAVWTLVGLCPSNEADDMGGLLADFISRVGVGDPYSVVFHLPIDSSLKQHFHPSSNQIYKESRLSTDTSLPDDLLVTLLRLLEKYLLDDSAKIVNISAQTVQGILSTARGQGALVSFGSYERALISIHSKGTNLQVVEKLLLEFQKNSCDKGISLDNSSLWSTSAKNYDVWVCTLVHALITFCDDIILRLCQEVVLLKSQIAELLFANILLDLAGNNFDCCHLISAKIQENIFSESNNQLRSIQILLTAMNNVRSFYVTDRASTISPPARHAKPSSSAKSRGTSENSKDRSLNWSSQYSSWEKVYWLSVDYLVVAKAAIRCGSYFTAIMYIEHWCEEQFNSLTLGCPDFSHREQLPLHIELLVSAVTQINEPDSIYGIIQSHKLTSQVIRYEHEGNWNKALECYDLLVQSPSMKRIGNSSGSSFASGSLISYGEDNQISDWKCYKGLIRSLQRTGYTHVLDTYCHGLTSQIGQLQNDAEFSELQYEAAWRSGNWDFSLLTLKTDNLHSMGYIGHFNENLHSCLRALHEGDADEFCLKLTDSKKELVLSISNASRESTENIYSTVVKLQILDHLGMAWDLRWKSSINRKERSSLKVNKNLYEPVIPTKVQLHSMDMDWRFILRQAQLHLNLLEPFIAFRHVMLQILGCKECTTEHLLESASTLRKGSRFSLATAALHELKQLFSQKELQTSHIYFLGRLEEAKTLRAQGQHEMAISLAKYILLNYEMGKDASSVYRLVGKWLAETRSSNSRTILEQYLKHSVELIESSQTRDKAHISKQCQTYFHLAHYADALFKSYEERLASTEWQAAMRLRKHKTKELDALIKRLRSSTKGEKTDYSIKIQELQKQLTMDREEAEKLQDDRDSFLSLALEGYERCLVIGGKYDLRVVFRLVSLWFSLYTRQSVVQAMHNTVKKVQSYKFVPLVYQIASRLGSSKDGQGSINFQLALVSLVKKMSIDHPYHTIFQLLALANGDRIKDKQRSRNSFVVDMDKKLAAENLLNEISAHHAEIIRQMKQMVEIYIKLAELETKKEETNKRIPLPREIRSLRQLELVPVVTATIPVDPSCQYKEGSFPHYKGLADSITVMNGINAPKVVECFGSDGRKYRQLAKSGNDDLRQDAVMEQFFGLVNSFLQNNRDTRKRKLGIRTYKVVPFTPSAGVLEWVDWTIPLGEYLLGRPVMHHFFLEKFLQPADWFERRLSYTRSVAASSMVGYIVGLGDRHSMNILIDQATAEVVHIDLGVAFEQGLMLKTPERVPFRLTRDIIDGMGITGVEGVFRRCCEETLSVMRTNKEALLTIIEVFIHDPLYKWALSPLKALQRQKDIDNDTDSSLENSQDAYEGNKDAARATLRVKQKLDGYEDGEMRSVQGQVQQLIQDAIDTDRLCQMFPGWGAWL